MDEVAEGAAAAARAWDGEPRARRGKVRCSPGMLRTILRRVATGETIQAICSEEGMPNRGTVTAWAKRRQVFREALSRAKTLGGWDQERRRRRSSYCEATAMEIYARLCLGESLTRICADPAMPSASTVALWREAHEDFDARMDRARRVQAERFCDLGWEIAEAVTPGDAYATHVKLHHLRWTAGVMAPGRFGRFKAVTQEDAALAEAAARTPAEQHVIFRVRHFKNETQADGSVKVVSYLQDSRTGEMRREHPEDD